MFALEHLVFNSLKCPNEGSKVCVGFSFDGPQLSHLK